MDGLTQSVELHTMLAAYKQQVDGFQDLISVADQHGAGRGLKARYWRKKADDYRAKLLIAQQNLARTQAEVDAFEAYNSPEVQAERFRRGDIDLT